MQADGRPARGRDVTTAWLMSPGGTLGSSVGLRSRA